ncbi:MAG: mercuric reductase [Gammaproteobacteria bacterium]|nr:mercuric reductase [Gammaproteobacteria bacterium]
MDEHNAELLDNTHPPSWSDPTPKDRYNLVVIGGGAGGLITAAGAAGVGANVALIEEHLLGGDCLNVGCVPSKALLKSAKVAQTVRRAGDYGVRVSGEVSIDFGAVMERMRRLRAQISPVDSATRYADELGVDVYMGRATFIGPDTVEVNGRTLRFAKAVIATGGTAAIPGIPGLDTVPYLTNASVFNLTELPKRLCVLGAGPIGIELAQAFNAFGSEVTVLDRADQILVREDADAAALVYEALLHDGVHFEFSASTKAFRNDGPANPAVVELADGRELRFDAVLVAIGRKPSVEGLGLEAAGVAFDARTGVTVDERLQTSNSNIYAVGDVASRYQFTHAADFMARAAIRNALFFGRANAQNLLIPWATYTDPEIAHVGLYPKDLDERGIAYETFLRDFADVDRTILDGEARGFVKIHVKRGSDEIVGATVVGTHAGDMISEITLAMQSRVGLGTIANVIHPYPTAADAIRQCGDAYNRTRLSPTIKAVFNRFLRFQRR